MILYRCGAKAQVCDCNATVAGLIPPLEEMKYLFKCIFSFLPSGVEAKRVMPPEFGRKFGTESLNTKVHCAYRAVCRIQREGDLFI